MRFFAALLPALFVAASLTPALASNGLSAKPATTRPATTKTAAKASTARRTLAARPATTRLKASLVAPKSDVLHEHFAVTVAGTITDANGQPLPGATIWKTNTRQILAVTNSEGDFSLTLPSNANVTLTCGFQGFEDQVLLLSQPKRSNLFVVSLESAAKRR